MPLPLDKRSPRMPSSCRLQVKQLQPGDRVMSPFTTSCSSCFPCSKGLTCRCSHAQGARCFGWVGEGAAGAAAAAVSGLQGSQAQYVRVPLADGTLVKVGGMRLEFCVACWCFPVWFTPNFAFACTGGSLLWLGW
jgi:threonine dehydrogenase-like Zn-dependent dehydrogenase